MIAIVLEMQYFENECLQENVEGRNNQCLWHLKLQVIGVIVMKGHIAGTEQFAVI